MICRIPAFRWDEIPRVGETGVGNWSTLSRILAIAVVISYGVFTWWMIHETKEPEVDWSRLVYVFQGVEALVFAAAGLAFGTSIHRAQINTAQQGERDARRQADEARSEADIGRALEAALRAYTGRQVESELPPTDSDLIGSGPYGGRATRNENLDNAAVAYLLRLSQELKRSSEA